AITPDAVDEYVRAFSRPGALRCGFDDYRADVIDDVRDEADAAAGRKPEMPMLVLWGEQGALASASLLSNWQRHAHDVRGQAIADSGHFLPEEAPEGVARELRAFFG
ncbi:MAG: haloacetate dehalogenase, partial [Pseudonocardiales bacterium]|nr:haloacetate dehalogenase [Pseudonocardiales bacterium]